jgi:hypothetical protein
MAGLACAAARKALVVIESEGGRRCRRRRRPATFRMCVDSCRLGSDLFVLYERAAVNSAGVRRARAGSLHQAARRRRPTTARQVDFNV